VDDDGRFRLFGQDNVNPGVERLTISLSTGNVGIGATAPTATLDVAGNINTSTQYNIGGNRILSGSGVGNVFAGQTAGLSNTTGVRNSFFGDRAGEAMIGGSSNSFFGERSGLNSLFINNSFFGAVAGQSNVSGSDNTIIGTLADVGSPNLSFATALGAGAVVASSNTIALGRSGGQDAVQIPGSLTVSGTLTANLNLADGSVTTSKLANGSVTQAKLAAGYFATFIQIVSASTPPSSISFQLADCPSSHPHVVGGGFEIPDSAAQFVTVLQSRPLVSGQGWDVHIRNGGNSLPINWAVYAVCAP